MQVETQSKWKNFLSDRGALFVIKILSVYAVWKLVFYFLTHTHGIFNQGWLDFITWQGTVYAGVASAVLNIFGEHTTHYGITVFYPESLKSIRVEGHCLAIPAMVVFTGSILLFGGSWKNKLWFISMGIVAIIIINLIRLVLLCAAFQHLSKGFYKINHSIIYVIAVYALIMLMIAWWMRRFGNTENPT